MTGKKYEINNVTIALNALHAKKEKIYPADVSNRIMKKSYSLNNSK